MFFLGLTKRVFILFRSLLGSDLQDPLIDGFELTQLMSFLHMLTQMADLGLESLEEKIENLLEQDWKAQLPELKERLPSINHLEGGGNP